MKRYYNINYWLMVPKKYTTEELGRALTVVSKFLPADEPYSVHQPGKKIARGVSTKLEKWYDAGKDGIIKDKDFFRIREDVKEELEKWLKLDSTLDLEEFKEKPISKGDVKEEDPFLQYSGDLFDKDNPRWL